MQSSGMELGQGAVRKTHIFDAQKLTNSILFTNFWCAIGLNAVCMRLKQIFNGNCSRAESASCTRFSHQFFFINFIDDYYHLNLNHLHCAATHTTHHR